MQTRLPRALTIDVWASVKDVKLLAWLQESPFEQELKLAQMTQLAFYRGKS